MQFIGNCGRIWWFFTPQKFINLVNPVFWKLIFWELSEMLDICPCQEGIHVVYNSVFSSYNEVHAQLHSEKKNNLSRGSGSSECLRCTTERESPTYQRGCIWMHQIQRIWARVYKFGQICRISVDLVVADFRKFSTVYLKSSTVHTKSSTIHPKFGIKKQI
jgi:hypothetical protein